MAGNIYKICIVGSEKKEYIDKLHEYKSPDKEHYDSLILKFETDRGSQYFAIYHELSCIDRFVDGIIIINSDNTDINKFYAKYHEIAPLAQFCMVVNSHNNINHNIKQLHYTKYGDEKKPFWWLLHKFFK